jgi:PPOX class probable F420-dependent enzyme
VRLVPAEAARRFALARVARLATVTPASQPVVVPCTFVVAGDLIYSAVDHKPKSTTELARLTNIAASPGVSLVADHYDEDWSTLWWARADGHASVLRDQNAMAAPLALLAGRYPQYGASPPSGPVIAVTVTRWSGWSAS